MDGHVALMSLLLLPYDVSAQDLLQGGVQYRVRYRARYLL
jgi:hypothetical protein